MNEVFITDQQIDQRLAKSYLPGQYLDIALKAGQYKIDYPAKALIRPQKVLYTIITRLGKEITEWPHYMRGH